MFSERKKGIATRMTDKTFRKTAEKLIPMLREQNVPELNEYANKLEAQLKSADAPVIAATLTEVITKLAQVKAANV